MVKNNKTMNKIISPPFVLFQNKTKTSKKKKKKKKKKKENSINLINKEIYS
jgi:hypothetical protein